MSDQATAGSARRRPSALLVAMAVVVAWLLLTAQERSFGTITDEQQSVGTAVAIAEDLSLGLPRGFAFAVPRPEGDALSPYGLGMPLVLAPACALAPAWERAFGAGSSQSLLVLVPLALVAMAALGAGLVARGLGAPPAAEALAALATAASPLWPLGSTAFSEPLQAAALAGAAACSLLSVRAADAGASRRATRLAILAGACAGAAVLTKGMNLVVVPWCLLPLVLRPSRRAALRASVASAAGAAPFLAAWLAAELVRFGRPLSSYSGQPFSHPPLDGLWRLTVGPNEGFFLYMPFALLAVAWLATGLADRERRVAACALLLPALVVLGLVSAWWAWDGSAGWGPRLLAPLVPLMAGAGGAWAAARARGLGVALVGVGACVNVLGVLQPDASILLYVNSCGSVVVADEDVGRWPAGLAAQFPPGRRRISMSMATVSDADFAPIRLHAFVLRRRMEDELPAERQRLLADHPPWEAAHPEARPAPSGVQGALSGVLFNLLVKPVAWPHWGACLAADPVARRTDFASAWLDALDDHVLRSLDVRRPSDAVRSATTLASIAGHDRALALLAESLRADGRPDEAERLLGRLPERTRDAPDGLAVRALLARDRGRLDEARSLLRELVAATGSPGARRALDAAPDAWPATIRPLLDPSAPW